MSVARRGRKIRAATAVTGADERRRQPLSDTFFSCIGAQNFAPTLNLQFSIYGQMRIFRYTYCG